MKEFKTLSLLVLFLAALAACDSGDGSTSEPEGCTSNDECAGELICDDGSCVTPPGCTVEGEVECCEDADCAEGAACDLETNVCVGPPECEVGGEIECCEDADCAEGATCDLETNVCVGPPECEVGGEIECCEDADCAEGETCDLETQLCVGPPECEVGGEIECCEDADCAEGATCDLDANVCVGPPECEVGGEIECCEDADCAEVETCDLETNVCVAPPACEVGGEIECCEDADCAEVETCDLETNVCVAPPECEVGGEIECCEDADCSETQLCDLETHLCTDVVAAQCEPCDPDGAGCGEGLFCHSYMNPNTGDTYSECGPAHAYGAADLCEAAAWDYSGCDAETLGTVCEFVSMMGSMELFCSCDGQWSGFVATDGPPPPAPPAACDTCEPGGDDCGEGLYCHTYMDPNTGANYSECGPAHAYGAADLCEAAAWDYSGCDAETLGTVCEFVSMMGAMELFCSCDGQWSGFVASDGPAPPEETSVCESCDPAGDGCGEGLVCHSYANPMTGANYSECGPPHVDGDAATCEAAAWDGSGCAEATLGQICEMDGIGGPMEVFCACDGQWSSAAQ